MVAVGSSRLSALVALQLHIPVTPVIDSLLAVTHNEERHHEESSDIRDHLGVDVRAMFWGLQAIFVEVWARYVAH